MEIKPDEITSILRSRIEGLEAGDADLSEVGTVLSVADGITRIHGPYVGEKEIEAVVAHLKSQGTPTYLEDVTRDEEEGFAQMDLWPNYAFTPDGKSLVYTAFSPEEDLAIVTADGPEEPRLLTNDEFEDRAPRWLGRTALQDGHSARAGRTRSALRLSETGPL